MRQRSLETRIASDKELELYVDSRDRAEPPRILRSFVP